MIFHKHRSHPQYNPGFTIVELLIVIVVIGILAAITIVAYTGIQKQAAASVLKSDLKNAQTQLGIAKVESGSFPADDSALTFSQSTTPEYTSDGSTYCLTVSSSTAQTAFYLDSATSVMIEGACPAHDGYVGGGGDIAFDQPSDCSIITGFIPVPGNSLFGTEGGFCVMKYEAKNVGGVATSQAAGVPWVSISQPDAITTSHAVCAGCHLISEAEWLTIAHNVLSVPSNWSTGTVGSGYIYSGHNDNSSGALAASSNDNDGYYGTGNSNGSQRRTLTLTNGEVVWDLAGNVWGWTSDLAYSGQPGASGYAWREWNTIAETGSLLPNPNPSYGTPAASGWDSSQGIGQLNSSSSDSGPRTFHRGGAWGWINYAGVFALNLGNVPGGAYSSIGFRVVK
ncbi:MAG TPA: prepilin-type N-terminal cleavage/methylation domain-containing protein, partial [Candidatus Saccharimonadales bacterium]|nr:prepilin-type N-terminal cleavage/methylation domain-containing protein [Candidatus Saccharimonadales bacterium]